MGPAKGGAAAVGAAAGPSSSKAVTTTDSCREEGVPIKLNYRLICLGYTRPRQGGTDGRLG